MNLMMSRRILDGRFVRFNPREQGLFLRLSKENLSVTWEKMAKLLGVSRGMVFLYLRGGSKLPLSKFEFLLGLTGLCRENFSYDVVPYFKYELGKVPSSLTSELAEFVGIMLGDGCSNSKNYQLTISCGGIDGVYIREYIPLLVKRLFGKGVGFSKCSEGGIDCRFSSKKVFFYLKNNFQFSSPKLDVRIPYVFMSDPELLRSCIRGLVDTDGGVYRHHETSSQISFSNKLKSLTRSFVEALRVLGYTPAVSYSSKKNLYHVYLFGDEVVKYFGEVGSRNPKNIIKFGKWRESGVMPLNKEIIDEVKDYDYSFARAGI